MGVLIDSDVLIAYERGRLNLTPYVQQRAEEVFYLSVVSASELLHGVWRADSEVRREKRRLFVEGLLERFPLLPIDLETARIHARLWADLKARGLMIGMNDSWLAATCLARQLTLVTFNERHFKRVSRLQLEVWQ